MKRVLLLGVAIAVSACQIASAQKKIPTFHFPVALGKPTFSETMPEPPLTNLPPELVAEERKSAAERKNLNARMSKDINAEARRLITQIGSSKGVAADLLACNEFCSAITLRFRDEDKTGLPLVAKELRKFCEAALAASAAHPGYAPAAFELREQVIRCDVALKEDAGAKKLAEQVLADNANQGFFTDERIVHDENMILAEIAFRHKQIAVACAKLHAAGESKGSPDLDSFGPRFPLILQLIASGQRAAVIDYLHGISKFWETETVNGWIKTIQAGKLPGQSFAWGWGTRPHRALDD